LEIDLLLFIMLETKKLLILKLELKMKNKLLVLTILISFILPFSGTAQDTPWFHWTFLPQTQMDEIIGEASGETAFNHVIEMGGYNRDRKPEEFAGTFWEAKYVLEKMQEYGLEGAEIVRFPGRQTWDGIKGELWEISPNRQKLASYQDLRAMLASGSNSADVKADLIWVGEGGTKDFEGLDVSGKIVVTSASAGRVHSIACEQKGAVGIISFNSPRPLKDPLSIPWSGIRTRGEEKARFAFYLPPREGHLLRDRLKRGEKITVHAQVEAAMRDYELQDPICIIKGTDPNADEIIFTAHLFEGYTKQGANDNISGSAVIMETARTLKKLIDEGRLPHPKRTIRFLWVPEFSGTIPWVQANKELMKRTLCNINLDMVGLQLTKSLSFMTIMRTTYGNPHYINDVMENYLRYVGETNRTIVVNGFAQEFSRRIVAPSGSEEPMYYYMGTHMGSSDHEVFNDWGVGAPGVVMNTWPDFWFHTSEDRPNKMDPTQLKRVVVISAGAAYTIANADDDMAMRIAGEITTNASRRIAHQLDRGLEELKIADSKNFATGYKKSKTFIEATSINERATLASILELGTNKTLIGNFLKSMQKTVDEFEKTNLSVLENFMKNKARSLGVKPVKITLSDLEKKAGKILPKLTSKIKDGGYSGYRSSISEAQTALNTTYKNRMFRRSATEVQLLIDGNNSALDIKKLLDTQFQYEADLEDILTHLDILKEAGLVTLK
jgi:aminopeptidase YwaD